MTAERRSRAISELPTAYAVAIRMYEDGRSDQEVGKALGMDPVAVGPFMKLALAKLEALLKQHPD